MDLTELTPAPWTANGCNIQGPSYRDMEIYDEGGHNETDAAFIALARNAFDVIMRRGWTVAKRNYPHDGWSINPVEENDTAKELYKVFDDPFTALVESDKWYSQMIDGNA